jgi:hypothetical protein
VGAAHENKAKMLESLRVQAWMTVGETKGGIQAEEEERL